MNEHDSGAVFDQIGEAGFASLVAAFYRRIPADPILGPLYPEEDFAGAEQRLCDFLVFRFGGPSRYIEQRGHPALRMRHAPFAITQAARDRWVEFMEAALVEVQMPSEAATDLRHFFNEAATFLVNR
ncbi:MAG TPA: globin [Pirellulaceae bacterium]|nr:globin [Planctomycetales bacterium]HRX77531.1 globin [Pirellulaceae bacterium]